MIRQDFTLEGYGWGVRVYYAVSTYWTGRIMKDLKATGCSGRQLERAFRNLSSGGLNTGITYSNLHGGKSVMVISLTSSPQEFLNSWMHEMRHLSRHIEKAFGIDPYGEEAAYLAGDIGQKMFPVARMFLCSHCRERLESGRH